jgi:hypothetical protein
MMPHLARQAEASCAGHSPRLGARPAGCTPHARDDVKERNAAR